MSEPKHISSLAGADKYLETIQRATEQLAKREAQAGSTKVAAARARREDHLRVAAPPIEEHIRAHIIADDLVTTPALEALRPIVRARALGFEHAAFVGLLGKKGRGKTTACAWAIAELGGRYAKIDRAAHLRKRLRAADEHEWERLLLAPVLAIDDLGIEQNAEDGVATLHDVIDERQARGHITILVSNLDDRALARRYDERTFDRLRSIWHPHVLVGESYRARREWWQVLHLDARERRMKVIIERAASRRAYLEAGAHSHEAFVELMWAQDRGVELAKLELALRGSS